jgi:hypothetical protein
MTASDLTQKSHREKSLGLYYSAFGKDDPCTGATYNTAGLKKCLFSSPLEKGGLAP